MNRIEEAIQKAKAQAGARHPHAEPAAGDVATRDADVAVKMRPVEVPARPAADTVAAHHLVLDRRVLADNGLWPPEDAYRRLSDEFRVVKRSVLSAMPRTRGGVPRRTIAVASALAGEGKTFSAFHLALTFAMERDMNVLLIDGDVARPTLTRMFGCDSRRGLLDVLDHTDVPLEEALHRTDVDRLWFMPSGDTRTSRAELLASPRMATVLDQLALRLSSLVIVIDTPPLLPTVESRAIVDAADLTLLVVKANDTPQAAVTQALEHLGRERQVQLLLNQRRETKLDQYYYYGYGTAYGARAE